MATPNPTPTDTSTPFDNAWQALQQDATQQQALIAQQQTDLQNYKDKLAGAFKSMDPQLIMLYLLEVIFTSTDPNDNSNLFGLENDQLGITGKSLRSMGDTTLMTDAIQNIMNGTGQNEPNDGDLVSFTKNIDTFLDALGANPNVPANPAVVNALGGPNSQAVTILKKDFSDLRSYFYIPSDEGTVDSVYNTATDPSKDPKSTALFDPDYVYDPTTNPNGKIGSFAQMQQLMQQTGDPAQANEAAQDLSNDFSELNSSTQSVNASLNEQVSQQTNSSKNVQSFYTSLVKSLIDLVNAVVQNITQKANS